MSNDVPLTKPRFKVQKDRLILIPNPMEKLDDYEEFLEHPLKIMRRIGVYDFFYSTQYHSGKFDFLPSVRLFKICKSRLALRISSNSPTSSKGVYNVNSEAFIVSAKIIDEFYREVLSNNALPVVILFPPASDLTTHNNGQIKSYEPLVDYLIDKRYRYIDMINGFNDKGYVGELEIRDLFVKGHYSEKGNEIVVRYISDYLKNNNLLDMESIHRETEKERLRIRASAAKLEAA